jgi:indole-3-glycerol phosphate synthase
VDDKVAVIDGLTIPDGQQVCTIANILTRNDKALQEIEEAWAVRDKGFNCVWVGEALYKSSSDLEEDPSAIIMSMKSKSSLKWASPKARSGRGEGAREYLGDILM